MLEETLKSIKTAEEQAAVLVQKAEEEAGAILEQAKADAKAMKLHPGKSGSRLPARSR